MKSNFLYDKCRGLIAFILILYPNPNALAQGMVIYSALPHYGLKLKNNSEMNYENFYSKTFHSLDESVSESYLVNSKIENYTGRINPKSYLNAGSKRFTLTGELPLSETKIIPLNALATTGVSLSFGVALHINQNVAWWERKYRSFYISEDGANALYADKFGHFIGAYATGYFVREGLIFSGVSWDESILYGSITALLTQTYIEVKDGFAKNTGFSPSDLAADFLGACFFYSQHYVPFLQNFSPKWQYTPPGLINVSQKSPTNTFLDNYNAITSWWSVNIHNLFFANESIWPKWLDIGFGYGINGYYSNNMTSSFLIGLDVNMVELLPDGFPFWNWFKQSLNLIKFPMPAVEFSSSGTKFYVFYPLAIL